MRSPIWRSVSMRVFGALIVFCLFCGDCQAETRAIGVQVKKDKNLKKVVVSIYSDEKKEAKSDIGVEEAAKILRDAVGWGSTICVGIVAPDVPVRDLLPLLNAIAENQWMELMFVEIDNSFIADNIKKLIKKDPKSK